MVRLVQIGNGRERRVALVEEPALRCLTGVESVYELAQRCLREGSTLGKAAVSLATGEQLDYDAVYAGSSEWRLLTPIDVPGTPSRLMVSGTGLTHVGSASDRQAMHLAKSKKSPEPAAETTEALTDSMKMFRLGLAGGRPERGEIGVAPEWFFKGDASVLRAPGEPLTVPAFGEDGGEEAEVAGVYVVGDDGTPYRLGMTMGNEFSDHQFEKHNYLNLAGSKLRSCSVGPELVVGAEFSEVPGEVRIRRGEEIVWQKTIATGEENMCHSLANLEHHHFKFAGHRQPGSVHVHFYGAHSLSFGHGIALANGDWMEVEFAGFGRALRNPLSIESKDRNRLVEVRPLG